ncbi:MAG: TadA family conjugal transfer-associated ATPase [Nostocoides sp.]
MNTHARSERGALAAALVGNHDLAGRMRERIRRAEPPDAAGLGELVAEDAALLGVGGTAKVVDDLAAELLGLGPLAGLVALEGVTDVLVNGDGSVWLDRGDGVVPAAETLPGPGAVRRLAVRLAGQAGRRLDDNQPWVDGDLPSGIRLHAVLPPIAPLGAHISLRVPQRSGWSLDTLAQVGMLDAAAADLLRAVVQARLSVIISGGTGSGKTSLLGAMLALCSPTERLVLVEDVRELRVEHRHVISLQGRGANVEGQGAVTLADLVRQALRMRPDRLVVGEVRGPEVRELLSALNTGHRGGFSTVHANAPGHVPARLVGLGALAGLSPEAVDRQLRGALDVVVHLARGRDGVRRMVSIAAFEDGKMVPAFGATDASVSHGARLLDRLIAQAPG